MSIQVSWDNSNAVVLDSVELYRSNDKGGSKTLIATLAGNALTYLDENVTSNHTYFYQVKFIKDDKSSLSPEFSLGFYGDLGPGPSTLQRGTWDFGFFGEVPATSLFTFDQIKGAINAVTTPVNQPTKWLKWIVNNKVIYIPDNYYAYNMSLTGSGNGYVAHDVDPSLSAGMINKDVYQFLVRPPYTTIHDNTIGSNQFTVDVNGVITGWDPTSSYSELAAIAGMVMLPDASIPGITPTFFSDLSLSGVTQGFLTNTYVDANTLIVGRPLAGSGDVVVGTLTKLGIYYPVLELQF